LKGDEQDALSAEEKGEFDKILATSIAGCYLPAREEFRILESDFGSQENKYVPQILPKLSNRLFWSSSGTPDNDDFAFSFLGFVYFGSRTSNKSVRCACAG
jgi:hypothetical protein